MRSIGFRTVIDRHTPVQLSYVMFNLKPISGFGTTSCGQANRKKGITSVFVQTWKLIQTSRKTY